MIDTHCHLTDPRLRQQLDDVMRRAAEAGVRQIITIATDLQDAAAALEVCGLHSNVRCAIGVHPNYSAGVEVHQVAQIRGFLGDPAVVAVGEMGLDYHYDRAPAAHQRAVFEAQLQIAKEVRKPVVIHCREAVADTLAVLKGFPSVRAIFHCFTGTVAEAQAIVQAGYFLGFTGPITYKKNDDLREVVRQTPIERMVVETDAPYLTPEPVRKIKTNEPAFVMHTARVAAQVKGTPVEELDRITTATAHEFFQFG